MADPISKDAVEAAQKLWGEGVVRIGRLFREGGDFRDEAEKHVAQLYAYELPKADKVVLFKPTKAAERQFRPTKEAAVSYFVGHDPDFREDTGFALKPWYDVRFENVDYVLKESHALAMGNYYFTDETSTVTKVEYTFGYVLHRGSLRINVHHSSLPYDPASH